MDFHLSRARRDHLPRPKGAGEAPDKVVPVLFFSGEEVGKLGRGVELPNIGFIWEISLYK